MSLMTPPNQATVAGSMNFGWMEPCQERELFNKRVQGLMHISGQEFLDKLDRGDFDEALEEETDLNLSYLVTLSALGR